jgi:hypothetical protein
MIKSALGKVMWVGRATVFLVGLAMILALIFGVLSRATAHTGSVGLFHLNHNNPVTALSTLTGTLAGAVLKVDNNGTGPALNLEVGSGKAPLTVNSTAGKATNLNADKLDGKHDNQLLRVASFTGVSSLGTGTGGTVATTTINAPSPGFLVIDAGVELWNPQEIGLVNCFIEVDNSYADGSVRFMEHNVGNQDENCSTNTVVPVGAGTHTVDLEGSAASSTTRWTDTALSAIYVPFGGTGAPPASTAVSAAQSQEEPQALESRK